MSKIDPNAISEFLGTVNANTKIYIGVDSQAFKRNKEWFADYYMVVAIHKNGCNGCKLFYDKITERDYSIDRRKPNYRLMQECYKVAELFALIKDVIYDYEVEVHLDLNPDKKYASSSVITQAIGYIKSSCNVTPMVKPDSWAATHAADRLVRTGNR